MTMSIKEVSKTGYPVSNRTVLAKVQASTQAQDQFLKKIRPTRTHHVPVEADEKKIKSERTPFVLNYLKNHWIVFPKVEKKMESSRGQKRNHGGQCSRSDNIEDRNEANNDDNENSDTVQSCLSDDSVPVKTTKQF